MFDNSQPEPGTPNFLGARFVYPVKAFKDATKVLGLNAYSCVSDGNHGADVTFKVGCYDDFPARPVELDSVDDEIHQNLLQSLWVSVNLNSGWHFVPKRHLPGSGFWQHQDGKVVYKCFELNGYWFEFELAGFDSRQISNVAYEVLHAGCMLVDDLQELNVVFVVVDSSVE